MNLLSALTLAGVVLMSVTVLIALGTLLWRSGQSETRRATGRDEMMGELGSINGHLAMLNGSVAEATKVGHENALAIAKIEGAHERPQG